MVSHPLYRDRVISVQESLLKYVRVTSENKACSM